MSIVSLPQYIHSMRTAAPGAARREQLEAVAEQFEAVFLQQILKQMRKAGEAFSKDGSMRGRELGLMHDLHDEALADALARKRQTGIAQMLVQQLGADAEAVEPGLAGIVASGRPEQTQFEALVASVIKHESAGNPAAVSPKGALGLMQLMPATAREMAAELGLGYDEQRLTEDSAYNRRLGMAYLDKLLKRYDGHSALALAAYNAGPARVDRWLERYGDPRHDEIDVSNWVEQIPFAETRHYIRKILTELRPTEVAAKGQAVKENNLAALTPRIKLPLTADGPVKLAVHGRLNADDNVVALKARARSATAHVSAAFAQPLRVGSKERPL